MFPASIQFVLSSAERSPSYANPLVEAYLFLHIDNQGRHPLSLPSMLLYLQADPHDLSLAFVVFLNPAAHLTCFELCRGCV